MRIDLQARLQSAEGLREMPALNVLFCLPDLVFRPAEEAQQSAEGHSGEAHQPNTKPPPSASAAGWQSSGGPRGCHGQPGEIPPSKGSRLPEILLFPGIPGRERVRFCSWMFGSVLA